MQPTVISVASRAVVQACEALGVDTDALLASAGAERDAVFDPECRISAGAADAIWQRAFELTRDPNLALHAAEALPFGAYRVVDFVVAHAPDVRRALQRIARYFLLVDPRASLELSGRKFVFSSSAGPLPPPAQQYTLAAIRTRLGAGSGQDIVPEVAWFTFPQPADLEPYERTFACKLRFQAPEVALVYSDATLDMPMAGADPALEEVLVAHAEHLTRELSRQGPNESNDFLRRVQSSVGQELQGGELSAAHVAAQLRMSERTLQRRLQDHGTTYADVLTQVRQVRAVEYLRQDDLSLTDVAFLLGFSEQSAFSRAFKRWRGMSPSAWRKRE